MIRLSAALTRRFFSAPGKATAVIATGAKGIFAPSSRVRCATEFRGSETSRPDASPLEIMGCTVVCNVGLVSSSQDNIECSNIQIMRATPRNEKCSFTFNSCSVADLHRPCVTLRMPPTSARELLASLTGWIVDAAKLDVCRWRTVEHTHLGLCSDCRRLHG